MKEEDFRDTPAFSARNEISVSSGAGARVKFSGLYYFSAVF